MTAHPIADLRDAFSPLFLSVLGVALVDVHEFLGVATMTVSLVYAGMKLYKDFFSNNSKNKNNG